MSGVVSRAFWRLTVCVPYLHRPYNLIIENPLGVFSEKDQLEIRDWLFSLGYDEKVCKLYKFEDNYFILM